MNELKVWIPEGFRQFKAERRVLLLIVVTAACLLSLEYFVIRSGFATTVAPLLHPMADALGLSARLQQQLYWVLGCVTFYALVPMLVIKLLLRERLADYGVGFSGFFRHLPIYLLLVAPVLIALPFVAQQPAFQHTYPFYVPRNATELVVWEMGYLLQFVVLEFFFRGFLLHGFRRTLGPVAAIVIMVLPYMMIHYPKPPLEAAGAVVAGVVLGALSLASGNIWGGVTAHVLVALSMDLLSLYHRGWFSN